MSGLLEDFTTGQKVADEILAEVEKETPNVEALVNEVINFLHLHFPGAAGLPPKPAPVSSDEGKA